MEKELADIFVRNHTFNTIYVQRHIWEKIPDYYPGLVGVQYYALIVLNCVGECKVSELAQMIIKEESAVTKLLNKLETAGLIQRRSSTSDKRVTYVSLTPECAANIERMQSLGAEAMSKDGGGLTEEDYVSIAEHMLALNEIFARVDKVGPLCYMEGKEGVLNDIASSKAVLEKARRRLEESRNNKNPSENTEKSIETANAD